MKERDKLMSIDGTETNCNIVGFCKGLHGKNIVIYTTSDNVKELLASYYNLKQDTFELEEIKNEDEWEYLEKEINSLVEKIKKDKKEE